MNYLVSFAKETQFLNVATLLQKGWRLFIAATPESPECTAHVFQSDCFIPLPARLSPCVHGAGRAFRF